MGCQTNLSFDVDTALALFAQAGGAVRKLRLWCTFHPTMTTVQDFAAQCAALRQKGVRFSARCGGRSGAAGRDHGAAPGASGGCLPLDQSAGWTEAALHCCGAGSFHSHRSLFPAGIGRTSGRRGQVFRRADTLFVRGDGACFSCNLAHRSLGNFYEAERLAETVHCSSRRCSCYLAYALREDREQLTFFDQHPAFRIPILHEGIKAIFFDIDGTLLDEAGHLRPRLVQSLAYLAQKYPLYLATQRPEASALRLLGESRGYFRGGVFADGAYLRPTWDEPPEVQPLSLTRRPWQRWNDWRTNAI